MNKRYHRRFTGICTGDVTMIYVTDLRVSSPYLRKLIKINKRRGPLCETGVVTSEKVFRYEIRRWVFGRKTQKKKKNHRLTDKLSPRVSFANCCSAGLTHQSRCWASVVVTVRAHITAITARVCVLHTHTRNDKLHKNDLRTVKKKKKNNGKHYTTEQEASRNKQRIIIVIIISLSLSLYSVREYVHRGSRR